MNRLRKNKKRHQLLATRSDCFGSAVLVIEDQRSVALLLKTMLEDQWGCEVHVANSLQEARILIGAGTSYLAALCDLNLPDAEHGEVVDVVNHAGIPSIALTAAFGEELREAILKKGVVDYVLKESINAFSYVCELIGRLAKNRSIKVLVVDDALSTRALLKQILEMYGLNVLVAENGVKGLEMLNQHPDIKLMLVDNIMPEMDGFALTIEARKNFGKDKLAIIGISATDDPMLTARFLKNGANDFIRKPFHFEEVICRVNQNLEVLELIEISQNAANCDFLTGLHNRRYFFDEGEKRFDACRKLDQSIAVAMIDIDNFKLVNDAHGHDCGDIVLKAVARELAAQFKSQLPARMGGEEFALLLTGVQEVTAREQLEAFRQSISGLKVDFMDITLSVTVSIGIHMGEGENLDEFLSQADDSLYQAKDAGRNCLVG